MVPESTNTAATVDEKDKVIQKKWFDTLIDGTIAIVLWFYASLPSFLWEWSLKFFSWPLARLMVSFSKDHAAIWMPYAMAAMQVVVGLIDLAYGIAYVLTPVAGKYKYYGILHITYLIIHTLVALFFIASEVGVNDMNGVDGSGRWILTYDHREIENLRVVGEVYGVLVVGSVINGVLQIIDLAKHGIYIPYPTTVSYEAYYMFINISIGLGCFVMCATLIFNCSFRSRSRPILVQRKDDFETYTVKDKLK